jgi:diguanylate cyclase (GGDEF)-like protein
MPMNPLDMRTVIVSNVISSFICMVVVAALWYQNRRRYAGLGFWLANFLLQWGAVLLIALRGEVRDLASMTLSNAMIVGGTLLLYIGLERFLLKRGPQIHNYILLTAFAFAHAYFVLVQPDMAARTIILSLGLLVICLQCAWLLLRRVDRETLSVTAGLGVVFTLFCLVSAARIAVHLSVPTESDFFSSGIYDTLAVITYQMLFVVLTFYLSLMVNRRLFAELGNDIAIRERVEMSLRESEEILRLRLRLWEYASGHSIDELTQRALDEIDNLTGSPIGFYHIVAEDQNAFSLQAWSSRTLADCKPEGKELHRPIDKAGVWAECARERRPVIHNDYASLAHRHDLPVGHAQVVRELVVPTVRRDRLVAILGVGNKPTDYVEADTEIVSFIADIVWRIVEQKRAEERIHELNSRLEQMAMTDELTGLQNRRSFFLRGGDETKRAHRYRTPLSLLMLDLDHFKQVNDTYGHDFGDLVLQCVAHALEDSIREVDVLARIGGEEFAILLPNTRPEAAAELGERLRSAVESETCSSRGRRLNVTVSVGVASYDHDLLDLDGMLRIADQAMYQAKNQGRNRVVRLP